MTDEHKIVPKADMAAAPVHPLAQEILARNPTPEALEKLMQLQREYEHDTARRAYAAALVALKEALPPWIERDMTVQYESSKGRVHYTHTSLARMMEVVTPLLVEHGFALTWVPATPNGKVAVSAKLTHRAGHSEQATIEAPVDTSGAKSAGQGVASTITLLSRYAAMALLGLASKDMTEPQGNGGGEPQPQPERIDTKKNMAALAALIKMGRTKEACEKKAGKPVAEWTSAELDVLRAWIKPEPKQGEPSAAEQARIAEREKRESYGGETKVRAKAPAPEPGSDLGEDPPDFVRDPKF